MNMPVIDYPTKLEILEKKLGLLEKEYLKVLKERSHYKKVCETLKKEKFLDYSEEELQKNL